MRKNENGTGGMYLDTQRRMVHFGPPEGTQYGSVDPATQIVDDFRVKHASFILPDDEELLF